MTNKKSLNIIKTKIFSKLIFTEFFDLFEVHSIPARKL